MCYAEDDIGYFFIGQRSLHAMFSQYSCQDGYESHNAINMRKHEINHHHHHPYLYPYSPPHHLIHSPHHPFSLPPQSVSTPPRYLGMQDQRHTTQTRLVRYWTIKCENSHWWKILRWVFRLEYFVCVCLIVLMSLTIAGGIYGWDRLLLSLCYRLGW